MRPLTTTAGEVIVTTTNLYRSLSWMFRIRNADYISKAWFHM